MSRRAHARRDIRTGIISHRSGDMLNDFQALGTAEADDTRRIAYTEQALAELHAAVADGVQLLGYRHWSALDN